MSDAPLLSMREIRKQFGATHALRGVDLELRSGQVLALIGENGAGKSTLMKVLSGAISPDSGEMLLAGSSYRPRGPADALGQGVSMIYQELNLAPELTVEDNIMLGREARRCRLGLDARRNARCACGKHSTNSATPNFAPSGEWDRCPSARGNWSRSPERLSSARECSCSTNRPAR